MLTEKLYYKNAYQKEFTSKVLEVLELKGKYGIILEKTCFYPEGGGQLGDIGKLDKIPVLDTQIKDGEIIHITEKTLEIGKKIKGKIDWARRYKFMQNHTAQHILSESFLKELGGETFSVHLGEHSLTLDVGLSKLKWEDVHKVENLANKIISENRHIDIHWVGNDELDKFPLRKKPKVNENIRIVEVGKFDYSPCGGTHLKSSVELGPIKVLKWIKIKNGFRVDFICGERALSDYQWKNKMISEIAEFLAVKKKDLKDTVEKLFEDNKIQRKHIEELQFNELKEKFNNEINQSQRIEGIPVVKLIFNDGNFKIIRKIVTDLIEDEICIILTANIVDNKVNLIFARSSKGHENQVEMNTLLKLFASKIGGKGGGKPNFAQGGGNVDGLEEVFDLILEKIEEDLKKT
ncbi:DHHA1 domain-containing protein [Promethearchaeum syntrophicum]|uniref:Alanine--tRNA ligase n=1 Tax=Promethearchaeum syntrophicum TaxID=2594042 RepID=A0A5B9D5Y8_9ARCH|nr:DHHA1 domain-containing protein [Candidatus Prometheoarchaeum syntrophicum]QEE14548.1 Alanine--tRNA ligase [Candidatus Prometheoarchaeum syntrophicum]